MPVESFPVIMHKKRGSAMESENKGIIESEKLLSIKRCTYCVLPVTIPFSGLEHSDTCIYCSSHEKRRFKGKEALEREIASRLGTLRKDREYDCIVPVSGGRDSSWMLHYVVRELGLKPLAYMYDWGMTTDTGYRNAETMCRELGVTKVVVDGNRERKRANIRKNLLAWLKKPDLGTVTLFMAGDKQVYFHIPRLVRSSGTDIVFWGTNYLERTDFKTGFLGIRETFRKEDYINLKLLNKIKLAGALGTKLLSNPSLLNSTLTDSLTGFFGYYFLPKRYITFYDYIPWSEETIESTLGRYGWEKESGYSSSWRIGDGTSALYNYIYCRIAGFSETDTFRSNQVREGHITREEALRKTIAENMPREESLRWYFRTVGVEYAPAMDRINAVRRLY